MKIIGLVDEDFVNYKKPSMFISFPNCSLKCDVLNGCAICQNSALMHETARDINKEDICMRYLSNPLTEAIVCGGLEPFDSYLDLLSLVETLRYKYNCKDDIVIYTGYTKEELENGQLIGNHIPSTNCAISYWKYLKQFENIYVKFGRFIMNQEGRFDDVLGVKLASENQYCEKISEEKQ